MTLQTLPNGGLQSRSGWSEGLSAGAMTGVVMGITTTLATMFLGASLTGIFASTRVGVGVGAGLTAYTAVTGFIASLLEGVLVGLVCGASGRLANRRSCLEVGGVVGLLWLLLSRFVSAFSGMRFEAVTSASHDDLFEALFMGAGVGLLCHIFSGLSSENPPESGPTTASEGIRAGTMTGLGFGLVSALAALISMGSVAVALLFGVKAVLESVLIGAICGAGDSLTDLKKGMRLGALIGIAWTLATKFSGLGGPSLAGGILEGALVAFLCIDLHQRLRA